MTIHGIRMPSTTKSIQERDLQQPMPATKWFTCFLTWLKSFQPICLPYFKIILNSPSKRKTVWSDHHQIPKAFQALGDLAQLKRGERCLIHAAAGGVGLVAIQYAQYVGAEAIATAVWWEGCFWFAWNIGKLWQWKHRQSKIRRVFKFGDSLDPFFLDVKKIQMASLNKNGYAGLCDCRRRGEAWVLEIIGSLGVDNRWFCWPDSRVAKVI